jgi:hypothetical protein
MTEAEWQARKDVDLMLYDVRARGGGRKLHLFACACCRQLSSLLTDARLHAMLDLAERCADGQANPSALVAAARGCGSPGQSLGAPFWAAEAVTGLAPSCTGAAPEVSEVAACAARALRDAAGEPSWSAARERQKGLLVDIYGSLFRTATFNPSWLRWNDGAVVKMVRAIYDGHRFGDLPVLADALEEAGCDSPDILAHFRNGGEHARGCWLVDLLLGKA